MKIEALRELILEIARRAPCDLAVFSRLPDHIMKMPALGPDGGILGPANIPQEELERTLGGRKHLEIRSKPTKLGEPEKLMIEQLKELKLVNVQAKPEPGSVEAIMLGGVRDFTPRVLGLTAKGEEFLELSGDDKRFSEAVSFLRSQKALTFSNLLRKLKKLANHDLENPRGVQ